MANRKSKSEDPVKVFLASAAEARIEAERLRAKLTRLEAIAARKGTDEQTAQVEELKAQTSNAIIRAEELDADATQFIKSLPDPAHRTLLKLRYCEGLDWVGPPLRRTVQSEMAKVSPAYTYSERSIYRLHGEALKKARELYKERQTK